MSKNVPRSTVNEQQYSAPAFQKSGFSLSHRRYSSYLIGRNQVSGFQYVMPGDKISGQNTGNFTMNRLVTPMISPVEVGQYNVFLPFRAVDRTFERNFAPSKLNNMSASWSTPKVNTRQLVKDIIATYAGSAANVGIFDAVFYDHDASPMLSLDGIVNVAPALSSYSDAHDWLYNSTNGLITLALYSLENTSGAFYQMADKLYLADALKDVAANIRVKLGDPADSSTWLAGTMDSGEFIEIYLDALLTPFIGRYSYYGDFHYKFCRPWDYYRIAHRVGIDFSQINWYDAFDNTPLCEYALRVMYVIWYERFRNVDLEPENSNLPYWRDFGSTSIFDLSNGGNLCYLLYRPRCWYDDMFINAQIDDMSRHVWAPIYDSSEPIASYHSADVNNLDTNPAFSGGPTHLGMSKPESVVISYRDQLDGTSKSITCPIPSNINDYLSHLDSSFYDVYHLDLNTLRQAQQLERYLKRNYLFGDEYQDRMLAHYNSRVSDMRINRPEIISSSLNNASMGQEIANMSNGVSSAGERTATGTLSSGGDQYTMFAEEFGLLVNVISFMPLASYDGLCPQLLLDKVVDFPLPEFATNNEEFGRKCEIADSCIDTTLVGSSNNNNFMFGRYPAYHAWRQRVDEVGGAYLDELQDCTFRRFWGMFNQEFIPKLNYEFIHCRPNLGMFANTNLYDSQIYGDVIHECYVERVLPTPVEVI